MFAFKPTRINDTLESRIMRMDGEWFPVQNGMDKAIDFDFRNFCTHRGYDFAAAMHWLDSQVRTEAHVYGDGYAPNIFDWMIRYEKYMKMQREELPCQ